MFDILIVYVFCKYLNIGYIRGVILILFKNSLMKEKENFEIFNVFIWRKIVREMIRNC